jgi:hypothetical protein
MVAQERMVVLLWTLDQKRSPRAGMGVMIPRYSGSIPVFPAFLFHFTLKFLLDIDDKYCIIRAQERMVFLLWTLGEKRSPRAGTGVMTPRYSGSIPVFPAFFTFV